MESEKKTSFQNIEYFPKFGALQLFWLAWLTRANILENGLANVLANVVESFYSSAHDSVPQLLRACSSFCSTSNTPLCVLTRDAEAEAEAEAGGSGSLSMEAEAEAEAQFQNQVEAEAEAKKVFDG